MPGQGNQSSSVHPDFLLKSVEYDVTDVIYGCSIELFTFYFITVYSQPN